MQADESPPPPILTEALCRYYSLRYFTLRLYDSLAIHHEEFEQIWLGAANYLRERGYKGSIGEVVPKANIEDVKAICTLVETALEGRKDDHYTSLFEQEYSSNLADLMQTNPSWRNLLTDNEIWAAEHSDTYYRKLALEQFLKGIASQVDITRQESQFLNHLLQSGCPPESRNIRLNRSVTDMNRAVGYDRAISYLSERNPLLLQQFEECQEELRRAIIISQWEFDDVECEHRIGSAARSR